MTELEKALATVKILDKKKAVDLKAIHITDYSIVADYFVIATGNSSTQVRALADAAEEKAKEEGFALHHREGYNGESWILLDFGDVIVHIFDRETREFYGLEHLWEDGKNVDITNITD